MNNFTKMIIHGIIFILFIILVINVTPGLILGNRLNGTTYGDVIETIPLNNGHTQVTAEYTVNNIKYTLIDDFRLQTDLLHPGSEIKIVYNLDKPDEAKLRDNKFPNRIFIIPYASAFFILPYSLLSFIRCLLKLSEEDKNDKEEEIEENEEE